MALFIYFRNSYHHLNHFASSLLFHVFPSFALLKVIRVDEGQFIPITSTEYRLQYNLDLFGENAKDHTLLSEDYVGLRLFEACSKWFKDEKQKDLEARTLRRSLVPENKQLMSVVYLCYAAKCLVLGTRPDQEFLFLETYFTEYVLRELLGKVQIPAANNKIIRFLFDQTPLIDGQDRDIGEDEAWSKNDFGHI